MPLAIGTRVGPYEVIAPLGAGGMGEVYRAPSPDGRCILFRTRYPQRGWDIELGAPVPLFAARVESTQGGIAHTYAVSADGQPFFMSTFSEQVGIPISLILNRSRK